MVGPLVVFLLFHEKSNIRVAAKLQDQFDVNVFQISPNHILVGDPVSKETIVALSEKYKGTVDEKWYGDLDMLIFPLDVVVSQRGNIVWDWRLRKNYLTVFIVFLVLLLAGGVALACYQNMSLGDYVKVIFIPGLAAYILGYKDIEEHIDNIRAKQSLEKRTDALIDAHIAKISLLNEIQLRQLQDLIYILRKCSATVPTWFAKLYKKSYDKRMQTIINKYASLLNV